MSRDHDWVFERLAWDCPWAHHHMAVWRCARCGTLCDEPVPQSVGLHGVDAYKPFGRMMKFYSILSDCDDEAVRLVLQS